LNGSRKRRRKAVDIQLAGVQAFRLQEHLVTLGIGELDDLIFD
jgi:hypothetical protein